MSVEKEKEFASLFKGCNIVYPTREQDMFEHWDVEVQGLKFDVKAMKRINRSDDQPTNLFNFIELKNVRGNTGWAYGKADAFAFETKNKWLLVKKEDLQRLIQEKVSNIQVDRSFKALYKKYTRPGRQDVVTMVHNMDLVEIAYKIISKPIGT
jgi:hypothetical protein